MAGKVSNRYGYVGYQSGATGLVTIDGNGSTWTNDFLYIGSNGSGTLEIVNDGAAVIAGNTYVASDE